MSKSDDFQNTLHAGAVPDEEDPVEGIIDAAPPAQLQRILEIFYQLNKSRRFKDFIAANYKIRDDINTEEKTITTLVIENPISVGPRLAAHQLVAMGKLLVMAGCDDANMTMKAFMMILGQEDEHSGITLDTNMDKAQADAAALKKFDA